MTVFFESSQTESNILPKARKELKEVLRVSGLGSQDVLNLQSLVMIQEQPKTPDGKKKDGWYCHATKTIFLKRKAISRELIVHEVAHAVIHAYLGRKLTVALDEALAMWITERVLGRK